VWGGQGAGEGPTVTAPPTVTLQTEELLALNLACNKNSITLHYLTLHSCSETYKSITLKDAVWTSCCRRRYNYYSKLLPYPKALTVYVCIAKNTCSLLQQALHVTSLLSRRRTKGRLHVGQRVRDCMPYSRNSVSVTVCRTAGTACPWLYAVQQEQRVSDACRRHYTAMHYITLHYNTLYYTTLQYTVLHYTALHYIYTTYTLHCTTLHYTTYTLHYTAL
jgi:hypothetical protein